jgi:hypothetical protein
MLKLFYIINLYSLYYANYMAVVVNSTVRVRVKASPPAPFLRRGETRKAGSTLPPRTPLS